MMDFKIGETFKKTPLLHGALEQNNFFREWVHNSFLFQIAKVEKLKPLEVELRRLEDLSESIVNDFAYMKKREEEMRDTNGEGRATLTSQWLLLLSTIKEIGPHTLNSGVPLSQFYQRAFYERAIAHFSAVAVTGKWALFDFQGNSIFFCNKQLIISVSLVYQINSTNLCNFIFFFFDNEQFNRMWIKSDLLRITENSHLHVEIISYEFQKLYLCTRNYLINIIHSIYLIPIMFIEHWYAKQNFKYFIHNLCNFNIYISDQMKIKEKTIWSPTVRFRGRVKLINCLFPWPFSLLSLLYYIYTAFCFVLF